MAHEIEMAFIDVAPSTSPQDRLHALTHANQVARDWGYPILPTKTENAENVTFTISSGFDDNFSAEFRSALDSMVASWDSFAARELSITNDLFSVSVPISVGLRIEYDLLQVIHQVNCLTQKQM